VKYKIVSKIIATRLQPLLPKLISKEQNAYIKGRSISDCIGVAQELTQGIDSGGRVLNLILNINMEKAFNKLN
jgi:hypothetical protein